MSRQYSVVGLGKLGASMAAAIASRGHMVVGYDVNAAAVDAVNAGRAPVQETDLEATIAANRARLRATHDAADAVAHSSVTFVVIPTPSDERGAFSLQYAKAAFEAVGAALAAKAGYHLVVLSSTVLPGAMRYGLIPVLEAASGKRAGVDFGVCYSPEFIALGSVIRDFLNPDFLLVGEHDRRAGDELEAAYAEIMHGDPPCRRMSIENAELTKIAVNTFVTTKITFANMLAELCERIPGGDVDVVTGALGLDARIGTKYLKGGLGYGGPCFPRDNVALSFFAGAVGADAGLARATDGFNRQIASRTVERFTGLAGPGSRVAVLGLAYKPASHVVEESQGVMLARAFAAAGATVTAHDPLGRESGRAALGPDATVVDTVAECVRDADVVLVTTPDPAYRALGPAEVAGDGRTVTVVDFWRVLGARLDGQPGIRYVAGGVSRDDDSNAAALRGLWGADAPGVLRADAYDGDGVRAATNGHRHGAPANGTSANGTHEAVLAAV